MNFNKLLFIFLAIFALSITNVNAQTQEEIEQMLNGQEETTSKKEKAPKEKKVKEEKVKAEKEPKEKKVKEEKIKAEKEPKEKKVKEEKIKAPKEEKVKAEKEPKVEKVKEEKVKAEKAPKESVSKGSSSSPLEKPYRTWSIGVFGGMTNPVTDIRYKDWFGTIDPINENQWGAGFKVTKMFDAAFGLQWQASYNVIQGAYDSLVINDRAPLQDAGVSQGIYFKNNVVASSLNIYWNISNTVFGMNRYYKAKMKNRPIKPRKFSLYMYSGVGATWFDPHVMFIDSKAPANFAGIKFDDKNTFEINIPIALGAKFKLGKAVDLGFEYVVNYVFTDRLDGYEFNHPGRIKNDLYTNLNMVLEFKLGTKKKDKEHIEWVNPMDKVYDEIAKIDKIEKKVKKLTTDADEDGVSDYFDKDTETEEGTVVDGSGVAIDSDGDGIPDRSDLEPFSDKDAEVNEFGIGLDDDNDGVPNHKDLEANSPDGSFVNFQGVAIEGKVKPATSRGVSFPSIFFDTDKADIKREYEDELFMIAKDVLRMEDVTFLLSGHCDERGSEEYNTELGERRANAVKNYLVENYGIDANRLEVISKGKSEINSPRFSINRRVDFLLIEK